MTRLPRAAQLGERANKQTRAAALRSSDLTPVVGSGLWHFFFQTELSTIFPFRFEIKNIFVASLTGETGLRGGDKLQQ